LIFLFRNRQVGGHYWLGYGCFIGVIFVQAFTRSLSILLFMSFVLGQALGPVLFVLISAFKEDLFSVRYCTSVIIGGIFFGQMN